MQSLALTDYNVTIQFNAEVLLYQCLSLYVSPSKLLDEDFGASSLFWRWAV